MKNRGISIACVLLLAASAGCGKKDGDGGEGGGSGGSGEDEASCDEKNAVTVTWSAEEQYAPGELELKTTLGFVSGMVYNGKKTAKLGYVALANYDASLGPYMVDVPKDEGQQVVLLAFKSESVESTMENQKEKYAELSIPTGELSPTWMGPDKGFQVSYFVGGQSGGPSISGSDSKGTATITTATSERICGSIDFTSAKGSTIEGTFNVPIEKDLWAK